MPFGVLSGVGRGMGVLDGGDDRRREGAVLGVNLGHPILTMGLLRRGSSLLNYFEDFFSSIYMWLSFFARGDDLVEIALLSCIVHRAPYMPSRGRQTQQQSSKACLMFL